MLNQGDWFLSVSSSSPYMLYHLRWRRVMVHLWRVLWSKTLPSTKKETRRPPQVYAACLVKGVECLKAHVGVAVVQLWVDRRTWSGCTIKALSGILTQENILELSGKPGCTLQNKSCNMLRLAHITSCILTKTALKESMSLIHTFIHYHVQIVFRWYKAVVRLQCSPSCCLYCSKKSKYQHDQESRGTLANINYVLRRQADISSNVMWGEKMVQKFYSPALLPSIF